MISYKTKVLLATFLFFSCFLSYGQNWIKKAPKDLGILIVEKFQSAGKNCDDKGNSLNDNLIKGPVTLVSNTQSISQKKFYCNVPEKDLDLNLELYQNTQKELFSTCDFQTIILSREEIEEQSDKLLADVEKYRYVLRYIPTVCHHSTDNFLQWGYYLYDRKTGTRSAEYLKDAITRFYPLESLVSELTKKYGRLQ